MKRSFLRNRKRSQVVTKDMNSKNRLKSVAIKGALLNNLHAPILSNA